MFIVLELVGTFALSMWLTLMATGRLIEVVRRAGLVDIAEKRSDPSADTRVACLGGLAVAGAAAIALASACILFEAPTHAWSSRSLGIGAVMVGGCVWMLLVGVCDDLGKARRRSACSRGLSIRALAGRFTLMRELSPRAKLAHQCIVAAVWIAVGTRIESIEAWPGRVIQLGVVDSCIVTLFWIVILINAINFIDGIDGLASLTSMVLFLALAATASRMGDTTAPFACVALAGASLGFLYHNWSPARIYLGDTGSMFLGCALVALSLQASRVTSSGGGAALSFPLLLAFALPLCDVFQVCVRRVIARVNPLQGDLRHVHHLLVYGLRWSPVLACSVLSGFVLLTCMPLILGW